MKVELPKFEHLPERINRLGELSYNLWWSWDTTARALFRSLDLYLWRETKHNPVVMLNEIRPEVLRERVQDERFLKLYDQVLAALDDYMERKDTWFDRHHGKDADFWIGYFCAEYGIHNSLPIYSGGLGVLAGDTCKEASDLGLPFAAVGYFYPEGYFQQRIGADGVQQANYYRIETASAPLLPVLNEDGSRFTVAVPVDNRQVRVAVWKVQAGRVPIFLMDTNIEDNEPWDRDLSARLYGGDQSVRLRQEIILGMGGLRVLQALGHDPTILHLNEGHAAFATLELLAQLRDQGLSLDEALEDVRKRTVFTTHTPVKAGHDRFSDHMMEEFFGHYWEKVGMTREKFLSLGRVPGGDEFVMTALALRTSSRANGVSEIHGRVSREMWHSLWPERSQEEVPIGHITNGVHIPTWVPLEMNEVFKRYLAVDWMSRHDEQDLWEFVERIPDQILWEAHLRLKARLVRLVQEKARTRWHDDSLSAGQLAGLGSLLDPAALTIGFARRFATYKRGNLILRDAQRLKRMLNDSLRPVQIVFAGKAHPADEPGKFVLQEVFQACMSSDMAGRVAFIEEYDEHVAHHMIQGVDVWLNNPRPPLEASGTSGQKSSLNGVPNLSVLDGWWHEGHNGKNGWGIDAQTGGDDEATAEAIYHLMEEEIIPLYYRRDHQGIPRQWVEMMKETIRSLAAPFSARRMMKQYAEEMYVAALHEARESQVSANP
ncbi:MAG TPA: alpha-glucan family phosphorylase [Acidobacteriota bacterium]|nr:alpha-glucan family phosphorylase [Acidobacteriota bacterium]